MKNPTKIAILDGKTRLFQEKALILHRFWQMRHNGTLFAIAMISHQYSVTDN